MEENTDNTPPKFPAMFLVHWPTGPVPCCPKHANGLRFLGAVMGSHISVTLGADEQECMNCVNEAKLAEDNPSRTLAKGE